MIGKIFINKENKTEYVVVDNEVWFLNKKEKKNTKCVLFKTNIKCAAPKFVLSREEFEEHYEPKEEEDGVDRIKKHWNELNKGKRDFKAFTILESEELKDGEPCSHRGCLNHVTHPCEGCGRIGGNVTRVLDKDIKK